ncbi:hypothetical protein [Streptomyces sp. NBC_00005]|uniref:hypothetical protein n=1 Tax=Streptomyces sp. NBC_00005 TaxID=2903609 RepID=UPI0032510156
MGWGTSVAPCPGAACCAAARSPAGAAHPESVYSFPVADSYEGHEDRVDSVPTYCTGAGGQVTENVDWSRVRYTGHSFIRVDVKPAHPHGTSTLTVRAPAATGAEVDRFTVKAG